MYACDIREHMRSTPFGFMGVLFCKNSPARLFVTCKRLYKLKNPYGPYMLRCIFQYHPDKILIAIVSLQVQHRNLYRYIIRIHLWRTYRPCSWQINKVWALESSRLLELFPVCIMHTHCTIRIVCISLSVRIFEWFLFTYLQLYQKEETWDHWLSNIPLLLCFFYAYYMHIWWRKMGKRWRFDSFYQVRKWSMHTRTSVTSANNASRHEEGCWCILFE